MKRMNLKKSNLMKDREEVDRDVERVEDLAEPWASDELGVRRDVHVLAGAPDPPVGALRPGGTGTTDVPGRTPGTCDQRCRIVLCHSRPMMHRRCRS